MSGPRPRRRFGASKLTLPQARRLGAAVDVRAGVYRLSGEVHTINAASAVDGSWTAGTLRVQHARDPVVFAAQGVGGLEVGRVVELEGYWDRHDEVGVRFNVERVIRADLPREQKALVRYMEHNIPGIGAKIAVQLVTACGTDVLAKLEADPDIPKRIKRGALGERAALGVRTWLRHVEAERWSLEVAPRLMAAGGIGYPLARRICTYFTSAEVADLITRRDPYRLLEVPGIGWETADAVARHMGVGRDDEDRISGAVLWAARELMGEGHSAPSRSALVRAALKYVSGQDRAVKRGVARLVVDGGLFRDVGRVYVEEPLLAECDVADLVRWLLALRRPLDARQASALESVLSASKLSEEQAGGVRMALTSGVSILTGGPGTGKTTTLKTIIEACRRIGIPVQIAAPTGKAAARAAEVTGIRAVTIHKLLGGPPGTEREAGPIRRGLLVVDEASMLDLEVFAWLAQNIRPAADFRLLIVGDENQLPSVGHGQVLADLIGSGAVPTTRLTRNRRTAEDGTIVEQAHRILRRAPLDLTEHADFRFVELPSDANKAQELVLRAVARVVEEERASLLRRLEARPFDPCRDLQVLTPRNEGPLGIERLNPLLGSRLNPQPEPGPWIGGGTRVRLGDRVICTENDYTIGDAGLMNGEQGVVTRCDGDRVQVRLDDGRRVETRGVQNGILSLAFAVTVHKCQGSEYPLAVVVFHSSQYPLLDPRLLYTAITRAKERVILCADRRALSHAERADFAASVRMTGLARRIRSDA